MAEEDKGPEIRYLGDLQRLQLSPGDRLVLSTEAHISPEVAARIRHEFDRQLPGVGLIILDGGTKLGVVGR